MADPTDTPKAEDANLDDGYDEPSSTPPKAEGTPAFEAKVKAVVDGMVKGDDGNWSIPEELSAKASEEVLYAAKLEKRYRDTQSAYTKANQKAKSLEVQTEKMTEHLISNATMHLSDDQRSELDRLKLRDPDQWRSKLNEYETEAQNILRGKIDEYAKEGEQVSELDLRRAKMDAFTESTGITLNDDVVQNQLPAAYSKQLSEGKIDFDEFLTKAHEFLTKTKVVKGANDEPKNSPNLGKLPGGSTPSEAAQLGDIVESYKDEVY